MIDSDEVENTPESIIVDEWEEDEIPVNQYDAETVLGDRMLRAERRLANVCVLCGEGERMEEFAYNSVDENGKNSTIHYSSCKECGGGYWQ